MNGGGGLYPAHAAAAAGATVPQAADCSSGGVRGEGASGAAPVQGPPGTGGQPVGGAQELHAGALLDAELMSKAPRPVATTAENAATNGLQH